MGVRRAIEREGTLCDYDDDDESYNNDDTVDVVDAVGSVWLTMRVMNMVVFII